MCVFFSLASFKRGFVRLTESVRRQASAFFFCFDASVSERTVAGSGHDLGSRTLAVTMMMRVGISQKYVTMDCLHSLLARGKSFVMDGARVQGVFLSCPPFVDEAWACWV